MPNPSINRLTGTATLLLLGLAGYWLGRPQPPRTAPAPAAETRPAIPPSAAAPPAAESSSAGFSAQATASDQPPVTPPAPDSAGSCPTQPLAFVSSPALRRPLQVRRYVGTVGGQPATAVLQWHHPDSVRGRFYLLRSGPEYEFNRDKPLERGRLSVRQAYTFADHGYWQLSGRPSAVLRGHWQHDGRQQAIELREDYAGALRYRVETRLLAGGPAADDADCLPPNCHVPLYRRDFLTPLAPAQAPPALRAVLVTAEAARRRLMRENREDDAQTSVWPEVRLNDYGLLSFQTILLSDPFGGKFQHGTESALYDLRTGQRLTIASQLRPGYQQPLRQLLTQHLLHDADFLAVRDNPPEDWRWLDNPDQPDALAPLPEQLSDFAYNSEYLALTGSGLEACYSAYSLYKNPLSGNPEEIIVVPYAELRPLVRPGSALDRMLKARGI